MLSDEQARRRLAAAMKLAGLTQDTLGKRLRDDHGLGVTDPERIMQGKKKMLPKDIDYISQITGVPEAWFTEPDLRDVWATPSEAGGGDAVRDAEVAEALAGLAEAQQHLERVLGLRRPGTRPEEDAGNG